MFRRLHISITCTTQLIESLYGDGSGIVLYILRMIIYFQNVTFFLIQLLVDKEKDTENGTFKVFYLPNNIYLDM